MISKGFPGISIEFVIGFVIGFPIFVLGFPRILLSILHSISIWIWLDFDFDFDSILILIWLRFCVDLA